MFGLCLWDRHNGKYFPKFKYKQKAKHFSEYFDEVFA